MFTERSTGTGRAARYSIYLTLAFALLACSGRQESWQTTTAATQADVAEADTSEGPSPLQIKRDEAQAAWETRGDEASLRKAIAAWKEIVESAPGDNAAWTSLSRAYYLLADGHVRFQEDPDDKMLAIFEKSVTAAERALSALSPEFAKLMADDKRIEDAVGMLDKSAVAALYWRSSSLGKWASMKGFLTLLSKKDEIKAVMEHCLQSDPEFFYQGPDRYFGVYFARAPAFAGGDLDKSRAHFDKSLAAQPNYFGTRVLMAQDLAKKLQDRGLFEEQLKLVIEGDPDLLPGAEPENAIEQRKAKLLLEQADEFFE